MQYKRKSKTIPATLIAKGIVRLYVNDVLKKEAEFKQTNERKRIVNKWFKFYALKKIREQVHIDLRIEK